VAVLLALVTAPVATASSAAPPPSRSDPGTSKNFQLIGEHDLGLRGMNAAPAMYGDYLYIGSRTDGSHPQAGIQIVDVHDPAAPQVVGEIGLPDQAQPAQTSRELRVWPQQKLLLVMNFQCSAILHSCVSPADLAGSLQYEIAFYDLTDPVAPEKIASYVPSSFPHEMFLWVDPKRPGRALLYVTSPNSSTDGANLIVADISGARQNRFSEPLVWNANERYAEAVRDARDVRLHSIGLTYDGRRTYLAYLGGGMLVLDTTQLANAVPNPKVRLLTPPAASPTWGNMTVHSAVKIPGRRAVLTTDEIYGDLIDPLTQPANDSGCPWGWVHVVDVADAARPRVTGEYRLPQNDPSCADVAPEGARSAAPAFGCATKAAATGPQDTYFTSYAAHNPTVVGNLAFVTWHSGGFQAIGLPARGAPVQAGWFSPEPRPVVLGEDPALSLGTGKVVMWSYPIIKDGLIYLVDVRNGLYIVRYTGPGAGQVSRIGFYEGNSNLGDARRLR
jgi:hypothetical protein